MFALDKCTALDFTVGEGVTVFDDTCEDVDVSVRVGEGKR